MNKQFLTIILCAIANLTFAQSPLGIGKTQVNAGVGLSSWGVPVYVGLDYGLIKDVTIGAEASFRSYQDKFIGKKYSHSIIGISGNANYHFNRVLKIPSKLDLYAGINIGFYIWNSTDNYPGSHTSGLGLGAQLGGRYFFTNKFGINLEVGGSNAFAGGKFGITLKL